MEERLCKYGNPKLINSQINMVNSQATACDQICKRVLFIHTFNLQFFSLFINGHNAERFSQITIMIGKTSNKL